MDKKIFTTFQKGAKKIFCNKVRGMKFVNKFSIRYCLFCKETYLSERLSGALIFDFLS